MRSNINEIMDVIVDPMLGKPILQEVKLLLILLSLLLVAGEAWFRLT